MPHTCKTHDGHPIEVGMVVIDYNNDRGVVVAEPRDYELVDPVCWPTVGHGGHWWAVCPDRPGHVHGSPECVRRGGFADRFDGSRLTVPR